MASDESLPDPPSSTYQPNNTAPLPVYSRYNIELSSLQQPQAVHSMPDVSGELQQQPRSVSEGQFVPPAVPARVPQPYSQPAQQFNYRSLFVDWDKLPQPRPPVPRVQTEEEESPADLESGQEEESPADLESGQEEESPADLESGQEAKVKDGEDDSRSQRIGAGMAISITVLLITFSMLSVVWNVAPGGTARLILFPWLAGLPYFILVAYISRPRRNQTTTLALRKRFFIKMICITLFHSFCGVGLAVFGGWIQYKFNAF